MPILWKAAIYREIAFSSMNWAQWDADIVKDVDFTTEHLSLPRNIVEELRLSYNAFPGKSIRETHVLVRMPKGLTIKKLGELAKKYFPSTPNGYAQIPLEFIGKFGDKPVSESVWLLMTRKEIDGSRGKSYIKQRRMVASFAIKAQVPYRVPMLIEATTCIFAEYSKFHTCLFGRNPGTYTAYTVCQERIGNYQLAVGNFTPTGLDVVPRRDPERDSGSCVGVAAIRKFGSWSHGRMVAWALGF